MTRYVFPILLVMLSLAIYGLYVQPLYGEIKRNQAREIEVNDALATAATAQKTLDEITQAYQRFPSDAEQTLGEILPAKVDPTRLLIETTAFMEHNGFSAKSLMVTEDKSKPDAPAPYLTHTVTFSISASYDTFRDFLRALESSLMLRDLASVSFSVGQAAEVSAKSEFAIHTYNVKIVAYSLH